MRLLLVGHSHVAALHRALCEPTNSLTSGPATREIDVVFTSPGTVLVFHSTGEHEAIAADWESEPSRLLRPIEELARHVDHIAILWSGNQHNVRALVGAGPSFDLLLPDEACSSVEPGAEIIPYSAVENAFRATLESDPALDGLLEVCASRVGDQVSFLGPPPPLPDDFVHEVITSEPFFVEIASKRGLNIRAAQIVPSQVRRKLWRVLLDVYRSFAVERGISFLAPPSEAQDADGLLAPPYWGKDVTHANAAYGALYLHVLAEATA